MSGLQKQMQSNKQAEEPIQEVMIDSEEADADNGYFELKLEEFK